MESWKKRNEPDKEKCHVEHFDEWINYFSTVLSTQELHSFRFGARQHAAPPRTVTEYLENATSNACAITKSSNLKWIRWCCVAIISIAVRCTPSSNSTIWLGSFTKNKIILRTNISGIWRCGESQAWQAHARTTFVSGYRFMNEN